MVKYEKALADWPKTAFIESEAGVHITGKYVPPSLPEKAGVTYGFLVLALVVMVFAATNDGVAPMIIGALAVVAWFVALRDTIYSAFGKNVDVKVTPEAIRVRGGWGYKNYSRAQPIEFSVERHQKGVQEEIKEHQTNKKQRRTYREAVEVVMQYGEKRVPLAELRLKDVEMAKALVIRLQNVCASLDEAVRQAAAKGRETAAARAGEFGPEPELP